MIDPGLTGKVVVVTGANNPLGIGAATARTFAAQGARVFLNYYRRSFALPPEADTRTGGTARFLAQQSAAGEEIARSIREAGGDAVAWEGDLGDPATPTLLFDRVEATFGPVDVLVNNAAHSIADTMRPPATLAPGERAGGGFLKEPITADTHDDHFRINSRAVALMMAEFGRRHDARGATAGRIVNVSTDGAAGFVGEVSYGASKHAMESYSRAAAVELGPYGITVNVVAPGPIQTGWMTPAMEPNVIANTPLRRLGRTDDIADVIVFLASDQARWVTGQLIYVGGGNRMPL